MGQRRKQADHREASIGPETLRAAMVSDALDALGYRAQCLPGLFAPIVPGRSLAGPAFALTTVPSAKPADPPYQGLLEALDEVPAQAVVVIDAAGRDDVALWGELLTTICLQRGASGAVCSGRVRDVARIRALGFSVFARGTTPQDIDGRLEVVSHAEPIVIGDVTVCPGDLIVGDDDGIVAVPRDAIEAVLALVAEKTAGEQGFLEAIRSGTQPSEAFAVHHVL